MYNVKMENNTYYMTCDLVKYKYVSAFDIVSRLSESFINFYGTIFLIISRQTPPQKNYIFNSFFSFLDKGTMQAVLTNTL